MSGSKTSFFLLLFWKSYHIPINPFGGYTYRGIKGEHTLILVHFVPAFRNSNPGKMFAQLLHPCDDNSKPKQRYSHRVGCFFLYTLFGQNFHRYTYNIMYQSFVLSYVFKSSAIQNIIYFPREAK